jgi:hypothetical protein
VRYEIQVGPWDRLPRIVGLTTPPARCAMRGARQIVIKSVHCLKLRPCDWYVKRILGTVNAE